MIQFGPLEMVIILIIVVLLFGVGRIGKISGELGSGIRSFRDGLQGKNKTRDRKNDDDSAPER